MGNKHINPTGIDLVHSLADKQRLNHAIYGYLRLYGNKRRTIEHVPADIVALCFKHIDSIKKLSGHLSRIREIITFLNTRLSEGIRKLLGNYFLWGSIREILNEIFSE